MGFLFLIIAVTVLVGICWFLDQIEKDRLPGPYNWQRDRELNRQLRQQAWDEVAAGEVWDPRQGTRQLLKRQPEFDPLRKALAHKPEDPVREQYRDLMGIEL
jgi:hypothetical protein